MIREGRIVHIETLTELELIDFRRAGHLRPSLPRAGLHGAPLPSRAS
jgi:hypothetical protein